MIIGHDYFIKGYISMALISLAVCITILRLILCCFVPVFYVGSYRKALLLMRECLYFDDNIMYSIHQSIDGSCVYQ